MYLCQGQDLNLRELTLTDTSSLRVYQFRHLGKKEECLFFFTNRAGRTHGNSTIQ